jgi:hypothetical protein
MKLLVKIPTRERRHQFFTVLVKAQRMRKNKDTRFLITLDTNDTVMNTESVRTAMAMWGNLEYIYGESQNKIHAVNRDMDKAGEWDILLLLSDDMHPAQEGYDQIIIDTFKKHFPDTDGILWINDGYTGKRLNTIICIGRKYYERFGFLYNPVYKSLFADNEYTDIAVRLQKYYYMNQSIIRHQHPMNTGRRNDLDKLYQKNDSYFHQDKKIYFYRKKAILT